MCAYVRARHKDYRNVPSSFSAYLELPALWVIPCPYAGKEGKESRRLLDALNNVLVKGLCERPLQHSRVYARACVYV